MKKSMKHFKNFKKTMMLMALAAVLTLMPGKDASAAMLNSGQEVLVWDKSYSVEFKKQDYYIYKLNLAQSGAVTFVVNGEITKHSYLLVYDFAQNEIYKGKIEEGINHHKMDLLAGNYEVYLKGNNKFYTDLKASFMPTFVASGETVNENYLYKNNEIGTASNYTLNNKVKAQFAINDTADIYKFKVSKPGTLQLGLFSEISSFDVKIVSADGNTSYTTDNVPMGNHNYTYFLPKGTYYISFTKDDAAGVYSFQGKMSVVPTTKVKTTKNTRGRKLKVTWSKKTDVNGYQVQVATNSKFTKNKKSKTVTAVTSASFSKLKKNKKYYVRVRSYVIGQNGKKYYSSWSKAKTVKIRK